MKTRQATVLTLAAAGAAFALQQIVGARVRRVMHEREELRGVTAELKHRNQQLTALYNVFSEITETLSLRYVIISTLRETIHLMHADMSVLRILRGDQLEVVGALASNGQEINGLAAVKLGDGPTGRAAKGGRCVKLDEGAELSMRALDDEDGSASPSAQSGRPPLESGIIMPLIVGARVVGTLSCWSLGKAAFNADDEHILEMMASQVATAVVAADAMENSERRAHHDALTDLPNRHQLSQDLTGDLQTMVEDGRDAVVAMVDIDHFKNFNDDFGHKVGDVTLQKVASILRTSVREKDRIYRYGGEEFLLVFADARAPEAMALAERVRNGVESTPYSGDQLQPVGPITISVGLAVLPDHATDFSDLIEKADAAMYRAKQAGRNRVVLWSPEEVESKVA